MKKLPFIFSFILFIACKESYKQLNFEKFNEQISKDTTISSAEDLMKRFYNPPQFEENSKVIITSETLSNGLYRVVLVETGADDDSNAGTKMVMTAKKNGELWQVIELKVNWKCHDGRGHTSWGITPCN